LAILQDKLGGNNNNNDHKFSVLAFPITDFHQEYNTDREIQSFLQEQYPNMIHFPIFTVSTLSTNPIFKALQQQKPEWPVRHNFFKYLIGPDGMVVQYYPKSRDPLTLYTDIEQLISSLSSTTR
jgi:glutathione peroxidase